MNGGKCETTGPSSYICKCGDRYRGAKCEVDTDPCRERPCLNNGKIISPTYVSVVTRTGEENVRWILILVE